MNLWILLKVRFKHPTLKLLSVFCLLKTEAANVQCNMYVKIALVIMSITSSYITSLICQNVLRYSVLYNTVSHYNMLHADEKFPLT